MRRLRQRPPGALRRATHVRGGVAAALLIAGCGGSDSSGGGGGGGGSETTSAGSGQKVKVAWLWYGPKNDGGYNVSQWKVAQAAIKEKYGDRVEQIDVEKVPYSARGSEMAEQVMRGGADLVIDAVAAGEIFTSVCARYPKVNCLEVGPIGDYPDSAKSLPNNVSGVFHEFWNQEYLLGIAAGRMTKTNTLGFVGSYNNPAVIGSANAFLMGCQSVNPQCRQRLIITNDYFNPPAAIQAANTLVNAGADVLHGWTDDPGFCEVAEQRKVRVVGQFWNYRETCPNAYVSGALWDYGPYYLTEIDKLVAGEWTGHRSTYLPVGEGANLDKWGPGVPASVQKEVQEAQAKIKAGETPFVGPISDAKGKVRIKDGVKLGPEWLYNKWTWPMQGTVS
jgi:simple sugar transport system substrate-binding protein